IMHTVAAAVNLYSDSKYWKQPYHTSALTGYAWVQELKNGHPDRIHCELGVLLHVFLGLAYELKLLGFRTSRYGITVDEQLAIFLY
ncbi:hypothetical protein BT96DRAFT_742584, partial [Gymnopus androsaceus JB14]